MTVGIYQIWIGDKFYIGRSSHIERRTRDHLHMLKNNIHGNRHMQRMFNIHQSFEWEILIQCSKDACISWEQDFIDTSFGLLNCMNLSKEAKHGGWTPEITAKATEAKKGKPRSEEVKKKLSNANKGKSPSNKGKKFFNGEYI